MKIPTQPWQFRVVFVGIFFIFLFHFNFAKQSLTSIKVYIAPLEISHFTFGMSEQIADNLWIRAIQDLDYCEKTKAKNECVGGSWLYRMLDLITDLSPHFRMPHAAGPLALTVLISDIEGASKLFDKAVLHFPEDWQILYRAAYQAMEEEKNYPKAADLLQRSAKFGGPPWFYALAGRLYTKEGRQDLAMMVYKEISQDPNLKEAAERLRKTIEEKSK